MIAIIHANPEVGNWSYVIPIDGVDECSSEESHREIITTLSKFAFSPFRFIIANRPEYAIRNTFSHSVALEQTDIGSGLYAIRKLRPRKEPKVDSRKT